MTVEQFLKSGKRIDSLYIKQLESELGLQASKELVAKTVITGQLGDERSPLPTNPTIESPTGAISRAPLRSQKTSSLELLQVEAERGSGGDHDIPYVFALPSSMRQALAWAKLLARVQSGELEP